MTSWNSFLVTTILSSHLHFNNIFFRFNLTLLECKLGEFGPLFKGEIQNILDSHRIEDIRDEQNLAYIKGERAALMRVRRFAGGIKQSYEIIKEREGAS